VMTGAAEATPRGTGAMAGALKEAEVALICAPSLSPSLAVILMLLSELGLGWGR